MHILLAEDEHSLGEWLSKALEQSGHKVDWRNDGRLIEPALANADYDVLVLDLGLPGLDGQAVLQRHRVLNLMTHLDPWQKHDGDHVTPPLPV